MIRYHLVEPTGAIRSTVQVSTLEALVLNTPDGTEAVACPDTGVGASSHRYERGTGLFAAIPPVPPSLEELRSQAWDRVKAARTEAECGGCETPLGRADTDPDSQRKIVGATLAAQLALSAGEPFSVDWTMADDSAVTHDAPAMIAMGIAVGEHVAACHAIGRMKRAAIGAAGDAAAIAAASIWETS